MKNFKMLPPNVVQPCIKRKGFDPFICDPIVLHDKSTRWRTMARSLNLSSAALLRLEWMIFYETAGDKDAYLTAKHFDIAPKTFYK